jgi:Family of unknown function (DUF5989)
MGEFVCEPWIFMKERIKFWLLCIVLVLMLFSVFIMVIQGSALVPFIYTLF